MERNLIFIKFKKLVENYVRESNENEGGVWYDGTWEDGIWLSGTWKNGTWI